MVLGFEFIKEASLKPSNLIKIYVRLIFWRMICRKKMNEKEN